MHFNKNSIIGRVLTAYNVKMGVSAWSYKWNFNKIYTSNMYEK